MGDGRCAEATPAPVVLAFWGAQTRQELELQNQSWGDSLTVRRFCRHRGKRRQGKRKQTGVTR